MNNDTRHHIKFLRQLATRDAIVDSSGFRITSATIKEHLHHDGNIIDVDALLDPSDRQNVCLAFALLKALSELPDAPPGSTPAFHRAREALKTFGQSALKRTE
jgi:hypothetical protein